MRVPHSGRELHLGIQGRCRGGKGPFLPVQRAQGAAKISVSYHVITGLPSMQTNETRLLNIGALDLHSEGEVGRVPEGLHVDKGQSPKQKSKRRGQAFDAVKAETTKRKCDPIASIRFDTVAWDPIPSRSALPCLNVALAFVAAL
ncbi:uncharacterized protein PAC_10391 [Phialocephala subalpina]|uniref:Uncharacterized protein n=1 Tax=Phialocephala subalpina TaxID=576137 RepID=A0A1L7X650_9HELO|nr:uncharacterized protein PAC_10391 [Phialocephala subalpina]